MAVSAGFQANYHPSMNTPSTDHMVSPAPAPRPPVAESTVGSRMELRMVGMVIGLATGVDYMSNLMFSIAGPHIEGGVLASQDVYLWAVTAYAAAASLAILVMGRLADHMTYRKHTLLSLGVFIVGTLMCAAAEGGPARNVGGVCRAARPLLPEGIAHGTAPVGLLGHCLRRLLPWAPGVSTALMQRVQAARGGYLTAKMSICSTPAGVRSGTVSPSRALMSARAIGEIQLT